VYCIDDGVKHEGKYDPGPFAGKHWVYKDPMPKGTHLPSDYAGTGNWEDYAETLTLVVSEAYVRSKDIGFRKQAKKIYDFYKNHDIGRRRKVMKNIISRNWR